MIESYLKPENGLQALLNDLCNKEASELNLKIIKQALKGDYSDFGSTTKDISGLVTLHRELKLARYDDLVKNIYTGKYDHNFGPKPSASHPEKKQADKWFKAQNKEFNNSMNFVCNWIKSDIQKDEGKQIKDEEMAESTFGRHP